MKKLQKQKAIKLLILLLLLPYITFAKPFVYYPEVVETKKEEVKNKVAGTVEQVKETAQEKTEEIKEKLAENKEKTQEKITEKTVAEKTEQIKDEINQGPPAFLTFAAGLSLDSDDFSQSGLALQLAYEFFNPDFSQLRISYTQASFDEAESKILALEKLGFYQLSEQIQLTGSAGLGLYQLSVDDDGSGYAIGTALSGGLRYSLQENNLFLGTEYQYKNAGVKAGERSYNAGYQGIFVNLTYQF